MTDIDIMENMAEKTMSEIEVVERKNAFCVISLYCNENGWYDIQDNSAWSAIPYENFAEVPDEMAEGVKETCGYLIPFFNEERTKLVDYTPKEIPVIEVPEEEPEQGTDEDPVSWEAMAAAIEEGVNSI